MEYYALINDKEYPISATVVIVNEEMLNQNKMVIDNKNCIDINKMLNEGKISELNKLYIQSANAISMTANDDSCGMKEKNEYKNLNNTLVELEHRAEASYQMGNKELSYSLLLELLEQSLKYNKEILQEESPEKRRLN